MYAGQNNEHDYLDYGYASLDGLDEKKVWLFYRRLNAIRVG